MFVYTYKVLIWFIMAIVATTIKFYADKAAEWSLNNEKNHSSNAVRSNALDNGSVYHYHLGRKE